MSAQLQTIIALLLVALAVTYLVRSALKKRKSPGCGDDCGAVSPEVRKLQANLRKK
jgi:hypothetical protein